MEELNAVPDTFPTLMWAYNLIWALLAIYIVFIGRRLARAEKRLSDVPVSGISSSGNAQ